MPNKDRILVTMNKQYPFGQYQKPPNQSQNIYVRLKVSTSCSNCPQLISRASILKNLVHQNMVKVETILQEQQYIHVHFQYVPIKVQTWISNINEQFIEYFREKLIKFSSFLANNDIIIDFTLSNIGMNQNYQPKYFINLDFEIDHSINRQKLKSVYIRDIYNLFKPYIKKKQQDQYNNVAQESFNCQEFKTLEQQFYSIGNGLFQNNQIPEKQLTQKNNIDNNNKQKQLVNKFNKQNEYQQKQIQETQQQQQNSMLKQFMDVLDCTEYQTNEIPQKFTNYQLKNDNSAFFNNSRIQKKEVVVWQSQNNDQSAIDNCKQMNIVWQLDNVLKETNCENLKDRVADAITNSKNIIQKVRKMNRQNKKY